MQLLKQLDYYTTITLLYIVLFAGNVMFLSILIVQYHRVCILCCGTALKY